MRRLLSIIINAVKEFLKAGAISRAAGVAFYTSLSFAPLVLLLVTFGGLLGDSTANDLVRFFGEQVGPTAGDITESVVENVEQDEGKAWWRWVVSIGVLLFSASGVFAELQSSLNRIWGVEAKPGAGIWALIRRRLLSMGMIFAILFILLVALVVSALLGHILPESSEVAGRIVSVVVSLLVVTLLFAAIFKFLPDVKLAWRDVWLGAFITAGLFTLGKFALSVYFEFADVGKGYDTAAASLIALLVWVYYSCIIFFFGAEVMQQVTAGRIGQPAVSEGAQRTEEAGTEPRRRPEVH